MKARLHAIILGLLTCALTGLAQISTTPSATPAPAPAIKLPALPDTLPPPAPAANPATPATPPTTPLADSPQTTPTPDAPAPASPGPEPAGQPPSAPTPTTAGTDLAPKATPAEPAALPDGALPVRAAEVTPAPQPAEATEETPAPEDLAPLIVIDDVPLIDAIRNLARQSELNVMFDPQIAATNQPNISIRFEDVSAQEALVAVLENYNLQLISQPNSKIARISVKDPKAEEPLFVNVVQLKYSDPTNLVDVISPSLSPRSRVLADTRTRQLIVTTTEKEMYALTNLIAQLDTPTRQVLIEARIMETSRNPETIKGIDWSGTLSAQNFSFGNNSDFQTGLEPTKPSLTDPGYPGSYSGALPGAPRILGSAAKGPFFNPTFAFLNADGVNAVLSFLNKDTETEVLATPRAVTLDNQPAELAVTRAFPIFQITPGSANSPAGATIQYTNLGTILRVTPRIAADQNISMFVEPEVSNIDGKDQQTLNGEDNVANIYAIRKIQTHVMIPSGHTLVMGGLLSDTSTRSSTKVPILGDIPLIGFAFRHSGKKREKQNLVIFVTPTIVEDNAFQVATSGQEYLTTKFVEQPDVEPTAWDSAKPHDWTKPVE